MPMAVFCGTAKTDPIGAEWSGDWNHEGGKQYLTDTFGKETETRALLFGLKLAEAFAASPDPTMDARVDEVLKPGGGEMSRKRTSHFGTGRETEPKQRNLPQAVGG